MSGLRNATTQRKLLSERNLIMSEAMEIAMEIAEMKTGHLRGTMIDRKDDNQSSGDMDVVCYRARMKRSTEVQKTSRDSKNACHQCGKKVMQCRNVGIVTKTAENVVNVVISLEFARLLYQASTREQWKVTNL